MRLLAILTTLALMGCAGVPAPDVAPTPRPAAPKAISLKPVCETVKVYTDAEGKALADFASALDPMSIGIVALADYARMRAEARACQAKG